MTNCQVDTTGEVYVTFDINQFTSSYDSASTDEFIGELYTSSTPQSAISSSQTTIVNTTKNTTRQIIELV